jgi:hypothetical protein
VSKGSGAIKGAEAAQDAARAFDEVRKSADIQYAPISMPNSPPTESPSGEIPGWLRALGRFFEAIGDFFQMIFEPLGRALGLSWPVLQWILIGLAVLGLLFLVWRLLAPALGARIPAAAEDDPEWVPDRGEAIALLDEADRLAGEGRYDEATHLLLERSVSHIVSARPGLLPPSGTAREICEHPALPERARNAFAVIAIRVERSFFALRRLGADDWHAARAAYADFALARLEAEPA